ncbi:MAG: DUF58 domain-containing protein [Desulfamplus sp.]|nr:DUF58 domain-containing protein [Desulfamplus sp.]MBF0412747.1 DUF58 domain-containing protein [Desulfamplus sp.]
MIPADIIKKIRRIHIKGSRTVNTMMAGQYKSVFRGSGIEFEEVREYSPGDDIKSIDWKVSARLGRPFIKLYREERESIVMLLIDMSSSLKFGTFSGMKLEKAAEVASVLAFSAIKNNDKVGAIFFTDRVEKYIPPKKGSGHIWRLITEIFTFIPEGSKTNITAALDFLSSVSRKKTLSFVISDFICNDYTKALRTARQRHELIGVIISDKGEFELPSAGIVSMTCFETGQNILIDAGNKIVRELYLKQRQSYHSQIIDRLKSARVDSVEVSTEHSVADTLIQYFRYREKRMRLM